MTDIHSTSASHFDYLQDDEPNPAGVSVTDLDPQQRLIRLRTLLVPLGNHLASHRAAPTLALSSTPPTSPPLPHTLRSTGMPLGEGRGFRMPLSFVYQAFPEMLRPLNAVSPEVLR